jgi:hypothetical protein
MSEPTRPADSNTGQVADWTMQNGTVSKVAVIGAASTNWTIAGVGDFSGDGTADILWRDGSTGRLADWTMQNGTISNVAIIGSAATNWQIRRYRRLQRRRPRRRALARYDIGPGAVWTGGHIRSVSVLGSVACNWQIVAAGDVTGDGTSDVIWRDGNTGSVAEWKMVNGAVNSVSVIGSAPNSWQITGTGDVDGDGTGDIVWHDSASGSAAEWMMASGAVSQVVVPGSASTNWQIVKERVTTGGAIPKIRCYGRLRGQAPGSSRRP